jgi:hypothetical protein
VPSGSNVTVKGDEIIHIALRRREIKVRAATLVADESALKTARYFHRHVELRIEG